MKRAIALFAICISVAACSSLSQSTPSTLSRVIRPSLYGVGETSFRFVDHLRDTPANGHYPELGYRVLQTYVLYPSTDAPAGTVVSGAAPAKKDGPFPLIVFAHGYGSLPAQYSPLLQQWADQGYVVVGPAFPLSNAKTLGGPTVTDFEQQPGDLTYVLHQVLALSKQKGDVLTGMIDPGTVAAVGHSLGAITVLAWTENTCCQEPIVDAAVVIDGATLPFSGGQYFVGKSVPLLVIHGTADKTLNYTFGQTIYRDATVPKFFVSLTGAPHTSFRQSFDDIATPPIWETVDVHSVLDFLKLELDHDRSALGTLEKVGSTPGVSSFQDDP